MRDQELIQCLLDWGTLPEYYLGIHPPRPYYSAFKCDKFITCCLRRLYQEMPMEISRQFWTSSLGRWLDILIGALTGYPHFRPCVTSCWGGQQVYIYLINRNLNLLFKMFIIPVPICSLSAHMQEIYQLCFYLIILCPGFFLVKQLAIGRFDNDYYIQI